MTESGIVKWLTHDKGFGFIAVDGGGMDVHFDHASVAGSGFFALEEGDRVEFERSGEADRPQARVVIKAGEGPLPDSPPAPPEPPPEPARRPPRPRGPRRSA